MKRKGIYLTVACVTFVVGIAFASIWLFQKHEISFKILSVADGFVVGGSGYWSQEWESSDGIRIHESMSGYSSEEDARKALEEKLKDAVTIIEQKNNPDGFSTVDERVIGNFMDPKSKEKKVSIIRLQKKDVYRVDAPSLAYVIAFEEYRRRER